jgi:hypothetical protein
MLYRHTVKVFFSQGPSSTSAPPWGNSLGGLQGSGGMRSLVTADPAQVPDEPRVLTSPAEIETG